MSKPILEICDACHGTGTLPMRNRLIGRLGFGSIECYKCEGYRMLTYTPEEGRLFAKPYKGT